MSRLFCIVLIALAAATAVADELSVEDLFRANAISSVRLSPDGSKVVFWHWGEIQVGAPDADYLTIHDLGRSHELSGLYWAGNSTLVVHSFDKDDRESVYHVYRLESGPDGLAVAATQEHKAVGYIDDPLVDNENEVVFAQVRVDSDEPSTRLFRFDVFEKTSRNFRRGRRVDTGSDEFYYYLKNQNDEYSVGVRYEDQAPQIWRRDPNSGDWVLVWTGEYGKSLRPIQLSSDGDSLWAISNAFGDKFAAIEFDLLSGTLRDVVFEHDRFDIRGILISDDGSRPYGVTYREQGLIQYEFFDDDAQRDFDELQARFPDRGIRVVDSSTSGNTRIVFATKSNERGSLYWCVDDSDCELMRSLAPWLDAHELSESIAISVPSDLGIDLDAFLTLPKSGGDSVPLVVMPHGGPIGISDDRYFSKPAQWLAHNGYAVLQVNYRGSSGYGREFQEAGLEELGRGIEDDIERATELVLSQFSQLDPTRVGLYGGSYGGYSALMSVIRNPELYRCAASWAGVTDLTLLFNNSRLHKNELLRESVTRIVGDPVLEQHQQMRYSPAYRYRELQRPILLGHGTEDLVVDVEHSWRLRTLLQSIGQDPEFVVLDDVGHSFEYVDQAAKFYHPLIEFLDRHLKNRTDAALH